MSKKNVKKRDAEDTCDWKEAASKLYEALYDASEHLDYCGYGDSYERSGAFESKLPEKIDDAISLFLRVKRKEDGFNG